MSNQSQPKVISLYKQYKTRDGRPVKILSLNDGPPGYPVVGVASAGTEDCSLLSWRANGTYAETLGDNPRDLFEVPISSATSAEPSFVPYRRYLYVTTDGRHALGLLHQGGTLTEEAVASWPTFIKWIDEDWVTHLVNV